MRLYHGKIPLIASELLNTLTSQNDIEVSSAAEVTLDFEAVLHEFLRREREVIEEAKDRAQRQGLSHDAVGRVRSRVAKELGFPQHDETLPYIVGQLLDMLFHSQHVDEVFGDDAVLRKKIVTVLRKHLEADTGVDAEVRSKIKNLQEGTAAFEIEYGKVMEDIKRRRGLE